MELIVMAGVAVIFYFLEGQLYKKFWSKGLDAEIAFQEHPAVEGETAQLKETVTNRKMIPLPILSVKFQMNRNLRFLTAENVAVTDLTYRNDMFSILPWQKITRTLTVLCLKRGYYACSAIDLVANDLFLTQVFTKSVPMRTSLYVYPALVDTKKLEIPFYQILGTVLSKRRLSEDPFEFRGIREYQSYDSMREVNWKATAKTGELKVNLHESTASQRVQILLNLESDSVWVDNDLREESIRIAVSMMLELMSEGILVSLISNGQDLFTEEPVVLEASTEDRRMVLETLSRVCYETLRVPFETILQNQRKEAEMGNTLYLLISSSQRQEMLSKFSELCERSPDSVWIAPLKKEETFYAERCLRAISMKWEVEHNPL